MIDEKGSLETCLNSINGFNSESQSNGCLMRTTPLAVFCHKLKDEQIYELTKKDVNLTHTHEIAILATTCYNIAIAHLLNNFGDAKGAIERVGNYVKSVDNSEFKDRWRKMMEAENEDDLIRADRLIGFIMIAFSYAFYYLKNDYTYEKAINNMLLRGGDTDTNAAIVGGLLGARYGINEIPEKWTKAVINCENYRPEFLQIKSENQIYNDIDGLIKFAPENTQEKHMQNHNKVVLGKNEKFGRLLYEKQDVENLLDISSEESLQEKSSKDNFSENEYSGENSFHFEKPENSLSKENMLNHAKAEGKDSKNEVNENNKVTIQNMIDFQTNQSDKEPIEPKKVMEKQDQEKLVTEHIDFKTVQIQKEQQ